MADVSIDRAARNGDKITVTGSGFTKTTTTFYGDNDETLTFDLVSDSEVTITGNAQSIYARKGEGVTPPVSVVDEGGASAPRSSEPYKTATPDHTPGDVTEDDTTADVSRADLADAANSPADDSVMTPEVEPTVVETVQAQGIGPRDPYPTGNPPNAEDSFTRIHGYKREAGPNQGTQPLGSGPSGEAGKPAGPNEGTQPINKE